MLGSAGAAGGAEPWALRISRDAFGGSFKGIYITENTITPDHENGTYAILYDNDDNNTLVYRIDEDGTILWRRKQSVSDYASDGSGSLGSSGSTSDLFVMGDFGPSNYAFRLNNSGSMQAHDDVWGGAGGVICSHPSVGVVYSTNTANGSYKVERLNQSTLATAYASNATITYMNGANTFYPYKYGSKLVYFPTDGNSAVYSSVLVNNHSQGLIKSTGDGTYTYKYVDYSGRSSTPSSSSASIGSGYYESSTAKFKYYMHNTSSSFHEFTVDKDLTPDGSQYQWTTSGVTARPTGFSEDSNGNRYFCLNYNNVFKVDASNNVVWGIEIVLGNVVSAAYSSENAFLSSDEDALYWSGRVRAGVNSYGATYIIKIPTDGGIDAGTYTDAGTDGDFQNVTITITDKTSALTPRASTLTSVSSGTVAITTENNSASTDNTALTNAVQSAFSNEVLTDL